MINSKKDYKYYIKCDEIARFQKKVSLFRKITCGKQWKYNVILRRMEYNENCRRGIIKALLGVYYRIRMRHLSERLGWFVGPNIFGPGLCIAHIGPVIVNGNSRFGANCKIQAMVNIGANAGEREAPHGGDFIYFGPGAKVFGKITLGSNVCIGANAVVNKSFEESNITIAGVPAKIVSYHGCDSFVIDSCKIVDSMNS